MNPKAFHIILVTAPDLGTARDLARAALEKQLIACANLVPGIESHYTWKGKVEQSAEILLVLKTTTACLKDLEKLIVSRHPYDLPEFLVLPVEHGSEPYLAWLASSCTAADS
jgi:periplasmic divalent cation tolerance protein